MAMMDKLHDMLIRHEGLRLYPYKCTAGKLTIGVGHNIDDNGIPRDVALVLLGYDINQTIDDLQKRYKWFESLDTVRQHAIIDMAFNLGITRFSGFKRFIAAMSSGDYTKARDEMLDSRWAKQVGNRAVELSRMILLGKYND